MMALKVPTAVTGCPATLAVPGMTQYDWEVTGYQMVEPATKSAEFKPPR